MTKQTADAILAETARKHGGVFTRAEALAAGLTAYAIRSRLEKGLWTAVHPNVYRAGTTRLNREATAAAGLLYASEHAMFSHFTAARLHRIDLPVGSSQTWLIIPHDRWVKKRPGLQITRTRHVPTPALIHDYPATPVPRTIVDLAQVFDKEALQIALHEVVRTGKATPERILAAAEGFGGKPGLALLHDVIAEFDQAFDSVLELEVAQHFALAGLRLERQVKIYDGTTPVTIADFADRESGLAIFVDGFRYHSKRSDQNRDRTIDRTLRRLGWEPKRFTTDHVRRQSDAMVREVREYLNGDSAA
jgi:very-short-patch-repair endonuclease